MLGTEEAVTMSLQWSQNEASLAQHRAPTLRSQKQVKQQEREFQVCPIPCTPIPSGSKKNQPSQVRITNRAISLVKSTLSKVSICPIHNLLSMSTHPKTWATAPVNSTSDLPDMFAFGPCGIASWKGIQIHHLEIEKNKLLSTPKIKSLRAWHPER